MKESKQDKLTLIIDGDDPGGCNNKANYCLINYHVNNKSVFQKKINQANFNIQLVKSDSWMYLYITFLCKKSYAFAFNIDQLGFILNGYTLLANSKQCSNKEFKCFDELSEDNKKRFSGFSASIYETTNVDGLYNSEIQVSERTKRFLANISKSTILLDYPQQFNCKTEDLNRLLESYDYSFSPYLDIPFSEDSKGNIPSLNSLLRKTFRAKGNRFEVKNTNFNTLSGQAWLNDSIIKFYMYWLTKNKRKVYAMDPLWNSERTESDKPITYMKQKGINFFKCSVILSTFVKDSHWRTIAVVNHRQHIFPKEKSKHKKCSFILMDSLFENSRKFRTRRTKLSDIKEQIKYLSEVIIGHAKEIYENNDVKGKKKYSFRKIYR